VHSISLIVPSWCVYVLGEGQNLEVWEGSALLARCSGEGLHVGVSAGGTGQLSGLLWSLDEQQLVYVAERVPDKQHASFFKPLSSKAATSDQTSVDEKDAAAAKKEAEGRGRVFDLRDDWGEKLGGSDRLALFRLDVTRAAIEELPGSTCGDSSRASRPTALRWFSWRTRTPPRNWASFIAFSGRAAFAGCPSMRLVSPPTLTPVLLLKVHQVQDPLKC